MCVLIANQGQFEKNWVMKQVIYPSFLMNGNPSITIGEWCITSVSMGIGERERGGRREREERERGGEEERGKEEAGVLI